MSTENQEQLETSYDVIEIPSKGLLYPTKKPVVKVTYLTAADENILTSPNLLQSGKFIDVLLKNKIVDGPTTDPGDLLSGDRNAIMIWLRATGYGEMYPVILTDPDTGLEFETEINLSELKMKPLGAEPDEKGLFDFVLPMSKKNIKFKLLTSRDEDDINKRVEAQKKNGRGFNDSLTHKLGTHIMSIEGNEDKEYIHNYVNSMRAGDSLAIRRYIGSIEPGVDMSIEVQSPGGVSFSTFLPIGLDFFWPDLGV
jgi:hypothetical protein